MTRYTTCTSMFLFLFLAACNSGPLDERSLDLEGLWRGSVTSPTAPECDRIIVFRIEQSGDSFTGTFTLLDDASGTFSGTINDGELVGDVTSRYGNCTGSGTFTGTAREDLITMYNPIITTFDEGCEFCQQNTLVLRPE